jgi:hypothetical protein
MRTTRSKPGSAPYWDAREAAAAARRRAIFCWGVSFGGGGGPEERFICEPREAFGEKVELLEA